MKPLLSILLVFVPILCALFYPYLLYHFTFNGPDDAPISLIKYPLLHHHQQKLQQQQQLFNALPYKPSTALVATPNGTMCLVDRGESDSMRVIWSFPTGSPIYHYQGPIGKGNASAAGTNGFMECGDDWALYMHDKNFGKMRITESIGEFVHRTPIFSDDGAATLGSKRVTLFEVDAKTGRIIHSHAMSNSDGCSTCWNDDKNIVTNVCSAKKNDLANLTKLNSLEMVLKILRTDYSLQSIGLSSSEVLWTLTVAEFKAVLFCQHTPLDEGDENASDSGLNFAMPCPCHESQEVFRLRKNFPLEPLINERLPGAYHENDTLSMPASDLMLPSQLDVDSFLDSHDNNMMLPAPMLPQPSIEITAPDEVYLNKTNKWSISPLVILFMGVGFSLVCYALVVKSQRKDQSPSESTISPAEDVLAQEDINMEIDEGVDGRRIGKLLVSNNEIAKGSNGTVIFKGVYDGRPVAVKRLVKAHLDVANKEIQNLILSDHHPNIVRWHGMEYDQDFVYLALERCTCSLDDLIQNYSKFKVNKQDLWKANGYPSPLLMKLMREIVSGVVHLHELGIIHRDIKPQNILIIIKGSSLCAKVSDMGISKILHGDMSSLGHNVTSCGSSGWQAPEQLLKRRQTRAVDLFSLGCVLFFCLTRGRHPFGEHHERDFKIEKDRKNLFLVGFIPEAKDLITCLLKPVSVQRPMANEVLHHPFFWSSETRLSFLRDTSDRVELEDRKDSSVLVVALENIATTVFGGKWNEKMEPAFIANIIKHRRYKFDSVRDLLRVMRNKLNHYGELPPEIQELVGPVPEGFNDYFARRFPKLLIEVYKVISNYCKEEEVFQRYFKNVQ